MTSTKMDDKLKTNNSALNPALMAVMANRFDAIVREMTSTLLRAGRSSVINIARDFSCSIITANDELLSAAEGVAVHVFGSHLQTSEMRRLHPDLREGDAFLDNDPYTGNSHHADHTILVPVFDDGQHIFTAVAKAHQADIGNSEPTQYMPLSQDIYQEGAINFPCVRIQSDYKDNEDIIRMCRRRIRVPDQWYGDYLAMLGAARVAEKRLGEVLAKYGHDLIRNFIKEWFDYSERRMAHAISELEQGTYVNHGQHDSFGDFQSIPLKVSLDVDTDTQMIEVDLRDNPDCVPAGLNLTRATANSAVFTGILNNIDPTVPHNAGSFRRISVHLRDNCVVGIPLHPVCCSVATTNVADRLVNITQAAFAGMGDDFGVAEGGTGMGPGYAVISGIDWRTGGPFVNQLIIGNNGGPGTSSCDGWLTWTLPVTGGVLYRDSVEIDEQKYPLHFDSVRLLPDSGGAGRFRGGACAEIVFGPKHDPMTVIWAGDGHETPAAGIHGGMAGACPSVTKIDVDGVEHKLPAVGQIIIVPGERIVGMDSGGGGFGDPRTRDPENVCQDVRERWVSREIAEQVYGVVLSEDAGGQLAVDEAGTTSLRMTGNGQ